MAHGRSTVRAYGRTTGIARCVRTGVVRGTGVRIYRYGCTHLQVRAFYFFATGVLTCTYGRVYGRSTFPFLSNIP